MRNLLPWAVVAVFVPLTVGVHVAAETKTQSKKPAAKTTASATKAPANKSATAKKSATANKSATAKKGTTTAAKRGTAPASAAARRRKGAPRPPAVTWRNRQQAPTPDRYREIQSALAGRGYLPAESANGQWNQESVDALKRFQKDQNLEPTGKLNSLSLIGLGLGPKYEAKTAVPVRQPPSQD
jgi:hypothetical protein